RNREEEPVQDLKRRGIAAQPARFLEEPANGYAVRRGRTGPSSLVSPTARKPAMPDHPSFRHLLPTFIISPGPQVVLKAAKPLPDGAVRQRGSVAVVAESPADNHPPLRRRPNPQRSLQRARHPPQGSG